MALRVERDDFDGSFDDILNSVNNLLNGTGEGFETEEELEESEMLKKRNQDKKKDDNTHAEV